MNKTHKRYGLFFVSLLLAALVPRAQVNIQFNASIYGQSLEGLSFVQVMNSYPHDVNGKIAIKVREIRAGNIVTIAIPGVHFRRGSSTLDRVTFANARFTFGNNDYARALSQSGKFPEGEYEYCFEIDLSETKIAVPVPFVENCFNQELQPLTPLLLINPIDGDQDCNKRPQFTWQPPMPMPPNSMFRLILVELKDKQDIIEAINYNSPIINKGGIPVNQLNYPFNAPDLQKGKRYAWQVILYSEKVILKRSEIWTYEVKCEEEVKEISGDSYREMKEANDGNYIADKIVRFSFTNPYNAGPLYYSIASLANPDVAIKGLPGLMMQAGLNKYDLDLSENKSFKTGQEYVLTVRLSNGRQLKLRFIYKNEE